jgi:hypothetical protein
MNRDDVACTRRDGSRASTCGVFGHWSLVIGCRMVTVTMVSLAWTSTVKSFGLLVVLVKKSDEVG